MTLRTPIRLLCFLLISLSTAPIFAKTIHILYFNDFHGQVTEDSQNPGMEKFASVVKAQEKNIQIIFWLPAATIIKAASYQI